MSNSIDRAPKEKSSNPTILKKGIDLYNWVRLRIDFLSWLLNGRPLSPPPLYKQRVVRRFARKFSVKTLVETGTCMGDMIYATRKDFEAIYSIELDYELFKRAQGRLSKFPNITLLNGDSAKVLPEVLKRINYPCLFWLDAHYSGGVTAKGELETPISKELKDILNQPQNKRIILIDDARCFVGQSDYPTIKELEQLAKNLDSNLVFEVKNDIIFIYPPQH